MTTKREFRGTKGAKGANKSTKESVYAKTPADVISLSNWMLQLPTGLQGKPDTKSAAQLVKGFQNRYFKYDGSDNSVAFFAPDNGVKTPHSIHPRSELREMQSDGKTQANWNPFDSETHTMKATLMVTDARHRLCIGQIHPGSPPSTKPLMELYYETNGDLTVGLNGSPTSGQTETKIGNVSVGTKFSYQITVSGGTLMVHINGTQQYSQAVPSGFKGYGQYFKAGNYNQTKSYSSINGTRDKFYALSVSHK
jgi:alginate lyase